MNMLVSDFDGTILRGDFVDKNTRETIAKLNKENDFFVVATGRSPKSIVNAKEKYGLPEFNYALASNGSIVIDSRGQIIKAFYLNGEQINAIKEIINKYLSSIERIMISSSDNELRSFDKLNPSSDNICSITVVASTKIINAISEKIATKRILNFNRNGKYLDITRVGIDKSTAINWLVNIKKVNINNVYSVGDDYNDITMLQSINKSFTYNDSPLPVKTAARYLINVYSDISNYVKKEVE